MSAAKGILIRASGQAFRLEANFTDSSGNPVTTGTATAKVSEVQQDGTLRALDFSANPPTIGATAATVPTTATLTLTNQSCGGVARPYWSATFAATNLTVGGVYLVEFQPPTGAVASNPKVVQYGQADGDGSTLSSLANLDVAVSTRLPTGSYVTPTTPPTSSAIATAVAGAILATPANKLATDAGGLVGANNLPADYQQRGQAVTLPTNAPTGYGPGATVGFAVAAGATTTSVSFTGPTSGTPAGSYTGRKLYHQASGSEAVIAGHTVSGSTHTVSFASGAAFPLAIPGGDLVLVLP